MHYQVELIGKLRHFFTAWYQITSDSIILEVIKTIVVVMGKSRELQLYWKVHIS